MKKKFKMNYIGLRYYVKFYLFCLGFLIFLTLFELYLFQKVPSCIQFEKQAVEDTGSALYNNSVLAELKTNLDMSNYLTFWAQGKSMGPVIRDNSKCVCLKKIKYEKGDIIAFFMNTSEGWQGIAHQIIEIEGDKVTTKGVNNDFTDISLKQENILCYIPQVWRYQVIQEEIEIKRFK